MNRMLFYRFSYEYFNRISDYWKAVAGTLPGVGTMLLNECLGQVHQDIVDCWNFSDEEKVRKQCRVLKFLKTIST